MSSTSAWTESAVVADASAIVDVITNGPAAVRLRERLSSPNITLFAPAIIDLEVLHTLRRGVLARTLDVPIAEAALALYASFAIMRFAHDALFRRIWELRDNFTAYDAAYVALAEGLKIPLITLDARLAKAAPPTIRVELFA